MIKLLFDDFLTVKVYFGRIYIIIHLTHLPGERELKVLEKKTEGRERSI